MIGFFEVAPENKSMGRLLAFIAEVTGVLTVAAGVVLAFMRNNHATVCITSGLGLVGSGELLKGVQKKAEVKNEKNNMC